MNIKQIENILKESGIETNEAKIEAKLLVNHFCKLSDIDLILNEEFEEREDLLQAASLRAKTRKPIQYIIGEADFMGEKFIVNEHVLIPRDETELLVKKAVKIINNKELNILDIGTGSGCIACMIAKLTDAKVLGIDISIDALQVALDNASQLKLFNKAIFRKSDIFSQIKSYEKFDIIISNPPYIPIKEKNNLQKEVLFEPNLALFTPDNDGIEFYLKIIPEAGNYLKTGGHLIFESGMGQSEKIKLLMQKAGFKNIEIEKDLAYINRVTSGIWDRS